MPTPPLSGMPPAEQEVDETRARALLAGDPELDGRPLRLLGMGWDTTVWLVDERWAVHFPRRTGALALQEREVAVLGVLAGRLPLAVPRPLRVREPSGGFPWPSWVGVPVPGLDLGHVELPEVRRGPVADRCGTFLGRLHRDRTREVVVAAVPDLPVDPSHRADMAVRVPWAQENVDRAAARDLLGGPEGAAAVSASLSTLAQKALGLPAPDPAARVLCHGDLHLRHLLVDGTDASGVIDWGDVCLGDPALDLALGFAAFEGERRDRFLEAYVDAGGRAPERATVVRARLIAVGLCAMIATTADALGDRPLVAENADGVRRALS